MAPHPTQTNLSYRNLCHPITGQNQLLIHAARDGVTHTFERQDDRAGRLHGADGHGLLRRVSELAEYHGFDAGRLFPAAPPNAVGGDVSIATIITPDLGRHEPYANEPNGLPERP